MVSSLMGKDFYPTLFRDPSQLFRDAVGCLLEGSRFPVVASGADVGTLLRSISGQGSPDLLLFGVGAELERDVWAMEVAQIRRVLSNASIVLLCHPLDTDTVFRSFACGFDAVISKDTSRDSLLCSLNLVMQGKPMFPLRGCQRRPSISDRRPGRSGRHG